MYGQILFSRDEGEGMIAGQSNLWDNVTKDDKEGFPYLPLFRFPYSFPVIHTASNLGIQERMLSKNSVGPLQRFQSQDFTSLISLPSRTCPKMGERYVLWSDIQKAFEGINYLTQSWGPRVLFMVDDEDQV